MFTTKRQGLLCLWTVGLALVLVGLLGSPGLAQDKETPTVDLQVPHSVIQGQMAELVVQVKNTQGQPLNGVPVVFQVDPAWEGKAVVFPQQTITKHGTAQAQFRADLIGNVEVTARVGSSTDTAAITVHAFPSAPTQ